MSETEYRGLVQAEVDKAIAAGEATVPDRIDKAVQAAVAQKEGERAKAQSLADQWKAESASQYRKQLGYDALFLGGGVIVTLIVDELVHLAIK